MTVQRIVANLHSDDPAALAAFYRDLLGLDLLMDHGFIATLGTGESAPVQLSVASQGGSGTELPQISVEVDALEPVLAKARALGAEIPYGPVSEPWGVRRFYLRDPAGTLINIVCHN
ncbi:glyoxalase [Thioclava sp. BHET1]|nr:glyoxalase [Thioclava sp. BHET1]